MKKLLIILTGTILLSCNAPVKTPTPHFQKISTTLKPGEIHNIVLDTYDASHDFSQIRTREQYNQLVADISQIAEDLFDEGEYVLQRGTSTMDELSGFNDTLAINTALGNINVPNPNGYEEFLAYAKASSKKKEGQIGILVSPSYPMASHHDKVADADSRGFKYEYSVARDEGAPMNVAYFRAAMVSAIFSAVKERELIANGE